MEGRGRQKKILPGEFVEERKAQVKNEGEKRGEC